MKIVAVVVTYNRLELLKKCIEAIRNQTLSLESIIVVNNSSTDGTVEWLLHQNDLIVINQENEGGAGGFYSGLKKAYEKGYDWIWIMDDDAFPEKRCLEKLMKYKNFTKILAPLVVEGDHIDCLHRGYFNLNKINFPIFQIPIKKSVILNEKRDVLSIDFISFIGLLINREVIEKIGYPIKEYYIFNDDVEYSLRMQKNNFSKLLVLNTCIYHKIYNKNFFSLNDYTEDKQIYIKKRCERKEKIPLFELLNYRNAIINVIKYSNAIYSNRIYIILNMIFIQPLKMIYKYKRFILSYRLLYIAYIQGLTKIINNQELFQKHKKAN